MTLGRQMNNCIGPETVKCRAHCRGITDIRLQKVVTTIGRKRVERSEIGGVRQLVNVEHSCARNLDEMPTYRRADKPGAPCDQNSHLGPVLLLMDPRVSNTRRLWVPIRK